jgi:hypothetical protein
VLVPSYFKYSLLTSQSAGKQHRSHLHRSNSFYLDCLTVEVENGRLSETSVTYHPSTLRIITVEQRPHRLVLIFIAKFLIFRGPGGSVNIATSYGQDGLRIESRLGTRFSTPVQTGPGNHPASCTMGTGFCSGVKSGRGVTLTPLPFLVPLVMKE